MRRPLVALVLAAALVAAACSGDYDRYPDLSSTDSTVAPSTVAPSTSTPPTPPPTSSTVPPPPTSSTIPGATTTTTPLPPGVPPGRLAVVADDGGLVTVRADGSEVTAVADAPPGGTVVQVAWSPDAARLAFSTTTNREAAVGVGVIGGGAATRRPFTTAPYHLAWDATQARLAYLRVDSVDTVEVGTIDGALATAPLRLRSGAPVSAAWSPDGRRLLAVVGEDEVSLLQPTGGRTALDVVPGPGGAPAWLDAQRVLVAVRTGSDQRLVALDVDTGAQQALLTYTGSITFLPDATGTHIAYQVVADDGGGGSGGRVSYPYGRRQTPSRQTQGDPPQAAEDVLAVLDLATGTSHEVLDEPAQAFQWSPDGSRLAFLDPQDETTSRWRFWSAAAPNAAPIDAAAFVPSATFVELVQPYFDQLAPSARWWAPDGSAFTFPGRIGGREGIWVVPTTTSAAPTLVHDGELVVWSPT
jgi:hypothetical protein